jgi:electron transport complex protein RnfB
VIDESVCIGCAKCLPACPVDAIVGARKRLHTVIRVDCSGCELCVPPCPVDCITMVPVAARPLEASELQERALHWRRRYEDHRARETARDTERRQRLAARSPPQGPI